MFLDEDKVEVLASLKFPVYTGRGGRVVMSRYSYGHEEYWSLVAFNAESTDLHWFPQKELMIL